MFSFHCFFHGHDFLYDLSEKLKGLIRLKCQNCGKVTEGWMVKTSAARVGKICSKVLK